MTANKPIEDYVLNECSNALYRPAVKNALNFKEQSQQIEDEFYRDMNMLASIYRRVPSKDHAIVNKLFAAILGEYLERRLILDVASLPA